MSDALLFRAQRYALFAEAAKNEGALEANEGIAYVVGVRLGLTTPAARTALAIDSLKPYTPEATFVRHSPTPPGAPSTASCWTRPIPGAAQG